MTASADLSHVYNCTAHHPFGNTRPDSLEGYQIASFQYTHLLSIGFRFFIAQLMKSNVLQHFPTFRSH